MSEDKTLTASNDAGAAGSTAGGGSAATRKKTTARASSSSRSARTRESGTTSASTFGKAALESQARARNPSLDDDPFQSGQRIWPD